MQEDTGLVATREHAPGARSQPQGARCGILTHAGDLWWCNGRVLADIGAYWTRADQARVRSEAGIWAPHLNILIEI